ncbi:N-glycosylase/DNA lyase [Latimeria chalumnae]|uniref:N-glycosylase/DNA lyase n=1 Tax=Latimeria chalumnae TaxID=7897 RepID=UPI00313C7F9A
MQHHAVHLACPTLWRSITCPRRELNLDIVLSCGQSFRWRETIPGYWTGVLANQVWTLTQEDDQIWYRTYQQEIGDGPDATSTAGEMNERRGPSSTADPSKPVKAEAEIKKEESDHGITAESARSAVEVVPLKQEKVPTAVKCEALEPEQNTERKRKDADTLEDYFQLNVKLADLYQQWSEADPNFRKKAQAFPGVRVLRQDPVECLFSFICTSNNNISRITGMIERLCQAFGRRLYTLDSTECYSFPTLQALAADDVEAKLRDLGFGYRAKFVSQSAKLILEQHEPAWLHSLRSVPYEAAKAALRALPGVGAKVADCVCLMSLDKPAALPVDTHVWQVAKQDYHSCFGSAQKSLTDRLYGEISTYFRELWGPYAGWAQAVVFCSDLKKFQDLKADQEVRKRAK